MSERDGRKEGVRQTGIDFYFHTRVTSIYYTLTDTLHQSRTNISLHIELGGAVEEGHGAG